MQNDLKPCPFCGSTDIEVYAFSFAPDCDVRCESCGARISDEVPWRKFETVKSHDKRCYKKWR